MPVTVGEVVEKFSSLLKLEFGPNSFEIQGMQSATLATSHDLIFISDRKHLSAASGSASEIWILNSKMTEEPLKRSPKVLISTPAVSLAMALIGRNYFRPNHFRDHFGHDGAHPSAIIHPSAKIGKNCLVGPGTVIGAEVELSDQVVIGSNCTVACKVRIGERTQIHPQVFIGPEVSIGSDCEIQPHSTIGSEGFGFAHDQQGHQHRLTHFGSVVIEDRVHIGAAVQIDRGTFESSHIASDVIIDNHCHFGHNVKIGRGTVITGGMIVAGSVTIGDRCVFGGRTTISGHLSIAAGSQFAGLSGIPSDVTEPGNYGGYPPVPLKTALKITSSLRHLPEMRKQLHMVLKKLGLSNPEKIETEGQ